MAKDGALVGILKAYIDETGTHNGAALSCAGGYLFTPDGADAFDEAWAPFVGSKDLGFFHAKVHYRRDDAKEIFSRLISLIVGTARQGVIRFIDPVRIGSLKGSPLQQFTGSTYSLCVLSCMERMAELAHETGDEIIYFIEDGNEYEGELLHFLADIKTNPELRKRLAMLGADTYPKSKVIQLQAADLLAWEFGRAYLNSTDPARNEWRTSLKELNALPHYISAFSDTSVGIQAMINSFYGLRSNRTKF